MSCNYLTCYGLGNQAARRQRHAPLLPRRRSQSPCCARPASYTQVPAAASAHEPRSEVPVPKARRARQPKSLSLRSSSSATRQRTQPSNQFASQPASPAQTHAGSVCRVARVTPRLSHWLLAAPAPAAAVHPERALTPRLPAAAVPGKRRRRLAASGGRRMACARTAVLQPAPAATDVIAAGPEGLVVPLRHHSSRSVCGPNGQHLSGLLAVSAVAAAIAAAMTQSWQPPAASAPVNPSAVLQHALHSSFSPHPAKTCIPHSQTAPVGARTLLAARRMQPRCCCYSCYCC